MIAIPVCNARQRVAPTPAALPNCLHARLSIGLDQAYCPDCSRGFKPRTPEYKSAIAPPSVTVESCSGEQIPVPQNTTEAPRERDSRHTPANGWIEKYLAKGRWEHHRYCWRPAHKGKTNKRHIPSDSGKLLAVRSAIASGKSPLEIEQLIKSWKVASE